MQKIDLTGQKFGKLTVIREAGPEETRKYDTFWICKCECGGSIVVGTHSLRRGYTRSCGCAAKKRERKLNKIVREGDDVVKILLGDGAECIIDAEDYDKVKDVTWCHAGGYACGYDEGHRYVAVHQRILGRKYVDHIDGNGLNNRKSNLRLANCQQNSCNKTARKDSKSGYKGVYRGTSAWIAAVGDTYIGSFGTPEEAARAYDRMAIRIQGEFACVNFPEEHPDHRNRKPARRIR